MIQKIEFHFQKHILLTKRTALKMFLNKKINDNKKLLEGLSIVFCTDNYLLKINKLYLNHDYFTDIISFDYSEKKTIINGELFISVDRIRSNAKDLGVSIKSELHRVIFHGLLHLLGHGDKSPAAKKKMRSLEDKWLADYFKN